MTVCCCKLHHWCYTRRCNYQDSGHALSVCCSKKATKAVTYSPLALKNNTSLLKIKVPFLKCTNSDTTIRLLVFEVPQDIKGHKLRWLPFQKVSVTCPRVSSISLITLQQVSESDGLLLMGKAPFRMLAGKCIHSPNKYTNKNSAAQKAIQICSLLVGLSRAAKMYRRLIR